MDAWRAQQEELHEGPYRAAAAERGARPRRTEAEMNQDIIAAIKRLHRAGVTRITTMTVAREIERLYAERRIEYSAPTPEVIGDAMVQMALRYIITTRGRSI